MNGVWATGGMIVLVIVIGLVYDRWFEKNK